MNPEADPNLAAQLAQAGAEIKNVILGSITDERGVHIETAIAAAGYLAGTAILKGTGINLSAFPQGGAVFVDEVNEVGPALVNHLFALLGKTAPPADRVPENHQPLRAYKDLLPLLWPQAEAILARHQIPPRAAPFACAQAIGEIILAGQAQLDPAIAKALAVEAIVKGSKTVPYLPSGAKAATLVLESRADFCRMLAQTSAEIDGFVAREPAYGVWRQLQQQLHAMTEWTAKGKNPPREQVAHVSIGLIAARELEPTPNQEMEYLATRLHLLNHYWRHWYGVEPARTSGRPAIRKLAIGILIAIPLLGAGAYFTFSSMKINVTNGTPIAASVRTKDSIATLISTLEAYVPSLNRNHGKDRYSVSLFLYPVDGSSKGRIIPLASGFQGSQVQPGARILGDDGVHLWLDVDGIRGWDYAHQRLISAKELRGANPELKNLPGVDNSNDPLISPAARHPLDGPEVDLWGESRRLAFDGRLRVTAPDYKRVFEVDPATLKAEAVSGSGGRGGSRDARPDQFLVSGAVLSPTEWLGVHSAGEAATDFRPGSSVSAFRPARTGNRGERRRLYRVAVEPNGAGSYPFRVVSIDPISGPEYLEAALVGEGAGSQALRLTSPDSVVLVHTSEPGLRGMLVAARVDREGKPVWTADTGIDRLHLQQILPGSESIAFVGTRPRQEGKVPEPILVVVHTKSGAMAVTTLWQ